MSGNIYGTLFRLATYGESHGPAIGGVIDGCPAGIKLDLEAIQNDLDRRKPGQSAIVTQRKEPDEVSFYSGIFEGKTTLKDFYRIIKIDDESVFEDEKGEAETLAGFVLEISKSFPKINSEINFKTYTFTVEALSNKRIKQLKVTLKK